MTQLLDNLVTNAMRYGDGKITVRLRRDGGLAVIAVHNQGPAIAPDQLATLFDPYKRASNSHGGVGLGLYIVEQIARARGEPCRSRPTPTPERRSKFAFR